MKKSLITWRRILYIIIVISCISMFLISNVLAKYVISNESDLTNKYITDFDVYSEFYFINPDNGKKTPAVLDPIYTNAVCVNLYDTSASNYIGNFNCDILYRGQSPFYIRVKIDSFIVDINESEFADHTLSIFKRKNYDKNLAPTEKDQDSWYDNTKNDSCLYWANALTTTENYKVLNLFNGKSDGYIPDNHKNQLIYINLQVEAIQINRYNAFWNMNDLPWRNG